MRCSAVCEQLANLRRALGAYATVFEPNLMTRSDASEVADQAAKIESIASVIKDLAGARAAEAERVMAPALRTPEPRSQP